MNQLQSIYGVYMVYKVISHDGKKYKFLADDIEFVKSFFSVKGKPQSIEVLREATEDDFNNLKSIG